MSDSDHVPVFQEVEDVKIAMEPSKDTALDIALETPKLQQEDRQGCSTTPTSKSISDAEMISSIHLQEVFETFATHMDHAIDSFRQELREEDKAVTEDSIMAASSTLPLPSSGAPTSQAAANERFFQRLRPRQRLEVRVAQFDLDRA